MMRASIVLADFAETDPSGKVHIIGAGWSATGPQVGPQAVIGFIQVPAEHGAGTVSFALRLADLLGNLVEVPGPAGMQPMELSGQVEVQEPEEWDRASDLNAAFSVNVLLPLPQGHSYTWSLEVDGKELATSTFYVRSQPPRTVVVPEPNGPRSGSLPSLGQVVAFLLVLMLPPALDAVYGNRRSSARSQRARAYG